MADVSWWLFLGASLAVIMAPGQDLVLVMSRGIGQGARAGIVTAAGVSAGLVGHTLLATFGLGALLSASETAFTILKVVGAAYLFYLGLRLLITGGGQLGVTSGKGNGPRRLFVEGAFSNLSNPKIALFYFAFLPQFTAGAAQTTPQAILAMGLAFALLTFVIKGPIGFFAGSASNWFRRHPRGLAWIYRSSGLVLIGLGLRLAFEERR